MTFTDVLHRLIQYLEQVGIPYMLTGSFASSFYGAPRSTQDIDLVIAPTPAQLKTLVQVLPESEFFVDLDDAMDAHKHESQFNLVDLSTGWKVDLIIRKSRPFSRAEFERRTPRTMQSLNVSVASPEDVILSKLEWAKMGQSVRQIEDVAGMLRARSGEIEREYIALWVCELELTHEWEEACRLANVAP